MEQMLEKEKELRKKGLGGEESVVASGAKQSPKNEMRLLRDFAPRNDTFGLDFSKTCEDCRGVQLNAPS
ncbi:MAG TPA: hypothetical protein ACFYEM_04130 [Candidatus Hypogeohydataceae bacterium YC40]